MVYIIVFGAGVFTYFMNLAGIPKALVDSVEVLHLSPLMTIFALLIVYLILGAIFDELSAMVITLPFVLPIIITRRLRPALVGRHHGD